MAQSASSSAARDLILAEALARVPGYPAAGTADGAATAAPITAGSISPPAAIRVEALTGGTVNRSFVVETPAGRYFLRLHEDAGLSLGADHAREAQLQAAAAAAGLAPPLVYADPAHRFAISGFLAGRVWTPADFADPAQLARLGATLRRVHEVLPPIAAPFDLPSLLEGFVGRIALAVPAERPRLESLLGRAEAAVCATRSETREKTLFHSDPHHSNLIELGAARLQLVDWEYAAVGDPLFDLACVLAYYPAAAAHGALLLEAAGLKGRASEAMLGQAAWLYTLLGYLWYRARRLDSPAEPMELEAEHGMLARLQAHVPAR